MTIAKVAVVYHSGYGHTEKQAKAVAEGAKAAGAEVGLYAVDGNFAQWDELAQADAIIFGSPTYMGSVSAAFKAFMDATSHAVFAKGFAWQNKIAAGFTNSASHAGDKFNTLMQLFTFASQHSMHWVSLGLPPGNNSSKGSPEDLNRLGFYSGAAAQSNADQGADVVPPDADLRTAAHLGQRVAKVAAQFKAGKEALES